MRFEEYCMLGLVRMPVAQCTEVGCHAEVSRTVVKSKTKAAHFVLHHSETSEPSLESGCLSCLADFVVEHDRHDGLSIARAYDFLSDLRLTASLAWFQYFFVWVPFADMPWLALV